MLLLVTFIGVLLIGYLAQTTGLCMYRGVNLWMRGKREFLIAILLSGVFAWVAAFYAYFAHLPTAFITLNVSPWLILGGLLFGLGTAFNKGCGVSTLGKLTRGDLTMLATISGWWGGQIDTKQRVATDLSSYIILMILSFAILVWVLMGNKQRIRLWLQLMTIGLVAGFLFLIEPKWPPSGLLNHISLALTSELPQQWPSLNQYLLFVGLLMGMFVSVFRAKRFGLLLPSFKKIVLHLTAGTLMGIGASLAAGGNDAQLLLAMPTLSVSSFITVASMLFGIWCGIRIKIKFIS